MITFRYPNIHTPLLEDTKDPYAEQSDVQISHVAESAQDQDAGTLKSRIQTKLQSLKPGQVKAESFKPAPVTDPRNNDVFIY
ncbi:MAG: hypothetical protein ACHP9Y_06070 [Gammaproteobacteria bacterium]